MATERRGRRFCVRWPLQYRDVGSVTWRSARTVNVSATGVLLRASPLPAQAARVELPLVVEAPSPAPRTVLSVMGRVVRHDLASGEAAAVEFRSDISWSPRHPSVGPSAAH